MNSSSQFTVEIEGLSKQFTSRVETVRAVDNISLKLPKGKMIAIRGSSGSGKSTLLNLIGALDQPTEGRIVVDGIDVSKIHGRNEARYRLEKVGFVFQSYYLIPNLTALENVMLPMDIRRIKMSEQRSTANRLLEKVGIGPNLRLRLPSRLSGGEQQRVAIARALANNPSLLLADEPTGNLDSTTGQIVIELLHNISQEGKTVILATHDVALASKADLVIEMKDGKIISS